ncbi:MAG: beta-galactosidase, partial [Armatimonadetes bacterium]|nr:beta-galactosidase [Armatimonadota bacterium]
MNLGLVLTLALALSGQQQPILGVTYSCPAIYLSDQYADKTGHDLTDGQIGRSHTVIYYRTHSPAITLTLPGQYKVNSVVAYCHRHNNNYKCRAVQLFAQQAGLWIKEDEKPGFMQPYAAGNADQVIKLEGKGMVTDKLRLVFLTAGILSISEIQVFGTPVAQAAPAAPAVLQEPGPARARVRQVDVDGDGKLDLVLENRWVRLVVSPARGGVVRNLVYLPTGVDLVCAQGANYGLLREQLWKPRYFFADAPCTADHGTGKGTAWVETRITGSGGMMSFTHSRKRLVLRDDSPVVEVEWEVKNDPSSMTAYEYGPWMHNWVGRVGAVTHYFVPTVEGVQEFRLNPGKLKDQANLWYWEPARGWAAAVSEPSARSEPPTALAFAVPYKNLACFYEWAGTSSPAATLEWRHGLVKLAAGEAFSARYSLLPFAGLMRVDGVVRVPDGTDRGSAGVAGVAPDAHELGKTVPASVQVYLPPGTPAITAVARWREYPGGTAHELARVKLKPGKVTPVWSHEISGAAGKAFVLSCQIIRGDKVLDEAERFFNFSASHVAYRYEPREKRTAVVEKSSGAGLPRHDLQRSVVTPHVPWARPYARGPLRALVLCDDSNAREVIELAQRLDLDFTYIKFRTNRTKEWIYQGDRTVPNLETAQKRLLKALDQPLDVAVIAGFDWQVHFTPEIRAKLAEKVRQGMGLVAIEPCGVPDDDPLAKALGKSKPRRSMGTIYAWRPASDNYITRALPWAWQDEAFGGVLPRTRRMEYERQPQGEVLATWAKDGKPLLVAATVGQGRVVAATYDVLTHAMSYRGFSALTPIISYRGGFLRDEYRQMTWPYWEEWWALLTRMVIYAARREAPVGLRSVKASVDARGQVKLSFAAEGKATGPLRARVQLTDRWGVPILARASTPAPDLRTQAALTGLATADFFRNHANPDDLSLLAWGARDVPVAAGGSAQVDLGPARDGWNFVRIVLQDARTGVSLDWALVPVKWEGGPTAVAGLEVDRNPVTDCRLLVAQGQPWARVFAPRKPLRLTVKLRAVAPVPADTFVMAELYDNHGHLLFRARKAVDPSSDPVQFSWLPPELRNQGLEWRVAVVQGTGKGARVLSTDRRRLVALPPRDYRHLAFSSWSANFLWRCWWLHDYLLPVVEDAGLEVGLGSGTEMMSGKARDNKWHNIRHSFLGLLDYPGPGVPGFRDKRFSEKAAKYAQTKDKKYLVREPCLHDPDYRSKLAEALKARIRDAAKLGFARDYCMGDEMSLTYYTRYFDYCFSPHTLAAFRQWLKKRYRDLHDLNQTWETNFA